MIIAGYVEFNSNSFHVLRQLESKEKIYKSRFKLCASIPKRDVLMKNNSVCDVCQVIFIRFDLMYLKRNRLVRWVIISYLRSGGETEYCKSGKLQFLHLQSWPSSSHTFLGSILQPADGCCSNVTNCKIVKGK